MDWQDLRIFSAFAESGSLSEAARATKLDHSTIGRRISKLEADLGVKLVDRLPRGAVLTAEGRAIAEQAAMMAEGAHAVERLARGGPANQFVSGTVTLSCPPSLAATLVSVALAELASCHPGLNFCLLAESHLVNLARNEADLALRLSRPEGNSLVARRVARLGFCLSASSHYASRHSPEDWRFVGYDVAMAHLPQQKWLEAIAGNRPFALRTNEQAIQAQAIGAGLGVGALPLYCADGLERLPTERPAPTREMWLVSHRDLLRARPVRVLFDYLAEYFTARAGILEGVEP